MKGLGQEETAMYLSVLHALRPFHTFHDTHVHPYEVLFDKFTYASEFSRPGILSIAGNTYTTPSVQSLRFQEISEVDADPKSQLQEISTMLLRRVYGNVGEQVFVDQMTLSGIDRMLLLPVAAESCTPEAFFSRMRWVQQLYGNQEKFLVAGSISGSLPTGQVRSYVETLSREYNIRAMKCHPVVSGIDLRSGTMKEWLEELLAACQEQQMPLIIHGGRNNPYWGGDRANFAALEHLKDINISISKAPVILAHAGLHRCRAADVEREGLKILHAMLEAHTNLDVDISGLSLETLKLVLRSVPGERVLFGSDALYSPQWEAVTLTMHALNELRMPLEEKFVQFASTNPAKTLFKEKAHAKHSEDQMESVLGGSPREVVPGSP